MSLLLSPTLLSGKKSDRVYGKKENLVGMMEHASIWQQEQEDHEFKANVS